MSELNYVPSWLDSAMTLLEKLNKCIEKIETIVNTVVSVTKTADNALSLAKTNETDINTLYSKTTTLENKTAALETKTATLETKTTALETDNTQNKADITRLDNNISSTRELTDQALSTASRAETVANSKSPKLYLHEIVLNTGSYRFKFFSITEESKKYSDKIKNGEAFSTTLKPFNCILSKHGDVYISKSLTLQLTDISLSNQNCNATIVFAAYLGDNNQIVTITDYPEWYSATIEGESVTEL